MHKMTDDQLHREVSRMARELADKDREIERLRADIAEANAHMAAAAFEIERLRVERDDRIFIESKSTGGAA